MERTPNKSQHTKLTLEKNILPPLLPGVELVIFRSRVRRSNQQAIPATNDGDNLAGKISDVYCCAACRHEEMIMTIMMMIQQVNLNVFCSVVCRFVAVMMRLVMTTTVLMVMLRVVYQVNL